MGILSLMIYSKILKRVSTFLGLFILFAVTAITITAFITADWRYALDYFSPFLARFFIIISAGLLFAFTTPPHSFAQSLQQMKFPTAVTFTMGITLRYIPTLAGEAESIFQSLKLRGIKFSKWEVIKNPSYFYRGIIIPLIIRTIKISDEIAIAAESRGFKCDQKRNSLHKICIGKNDILFLTTLSLIFIIIIFLDKNLLFLNLS